jgi:hypothetical protein
MSSVFNNIHIPANSMGIEMKYEQSSESSDVSSMEPSPLSDLSFVAKSSAIDKREVRAISWQEKKSFTYFSSS